jgi:hypothetical protein
VRDLDIIYEVKVSLRGRVVPEGPPAPSLQQVVMDFKKVHFETLDMVKAFHGML